MKFINYLWFEELFNKNFNKFILFVGYGDNKILLKDKKTSFFTEKTYTLSEARNEKQYIYLDKLNDHNNKFLIVTGSNFTGKTLLSMEYGMDKFVKNEYNKMVFICPNEDKNSSRPLKYDFPLRVSKIYSMLDSFIGNEEINEMFINRRIEIIRYSDMKGKKFHNSWIMAFDSENSSKEQMKNILITMGKASRMIVLGKDEDSEGIIDIKERVETHSSDTITCVEFDDDDIENDTVTIEILELYKDITPRPSSNTINRDTFVKIGQSLLGKSL